MSIGTIVALMLVVLASLAMLTAFWLASNGLLAYGQDDQDALSTPVTSQPADLPLEGVAEAEPTLTPAPTLPPSAGISEEAAAQLDAFLNAQPGSVSVWLMDIASGDTYAYAPENGFYCASTLKAPYALWLALRDEAGEIDLDQVWNGYTGWDRIYTMITVSSNDAAHGLASMWPATADTGFQEFLAQLGFAAPEGCEITPEDGISGWTTGQDGGLAMLALYEYFETNTENAWRLQQTFLEAQHDYLWFPAPAAKKYGSWDNAFHDMGICYSEAPYILSVFTSYGTQDEPPAEGIEMMRQLGQLTAELLGQTE